MNVYSEKIRMPRLRGWTIKVGLRVLMSRELGEDESFGSSGRPTNTWIHGPGRVGIYVWRWNVRARIRRGWEMGAGWCD